MQFRVGTHLYRVCIVRGWVIIDEHVPAERRRSVLFHELRHAWLAEFGQPRDEEHDARQASTYAEVINDQLEQQGGVRALMALKPPAPDAETKTRPLQANSLWDIPAEPGGSQCPLCESTIAAGAIVSEAPALFAALGRPAMDRGFWCEFCSCVITWKEGATAGGLPNGRLVAGPSVLQGQEARRWLNDHGRLARIHAA